MAAVLQRDDVNFRIITPYDAQRALIENSLKQAGLAHANKCFNVDSFQGESFTHTSLASDAYLDL